MILTVNEVMIIKLSKLLIMKCIAAMACIAILLGGYIYNMAQPVSSLPGAPVLVNIKSGMSAADIGSVLYRQGLIKNIAVFRALIHVQRLENSLQAGEYSFTSAMSVQRIITMIVKGEVTYLQFTVPEGFTIDQIAKLMEEKQLVTATNFKQAAKDYLPFDYIQPANNVNYKPEGFLFPDTYRVPRGSKEVDLLRVMTDQFNRLFTADMRNRAKEQGLSVREAIILASLVEKEALVAAERPIIARVFMNRLKQGMPLQSCATIQYILGYPKAELTIKDTELPSPYNTYQNSGLPPGPIANPGLASIKAILFPAETDYLYFVADKSGKHHFSKTYEEHLAAIDVISAAN